MPVPITTEELCIILAIFRSQQAMIDSMQRQINILTGIPELPTVETNTSKNIKELHKAALDAGDAIERDTYQPTGE